MRYILSFILVSFNLSFLISQDPVTQIEGNIELYPLSPNKDLSSLHINTNIIVPNSLGNIGNTFVGSNAGKDNVFGIGNSFFGRNAGTSSTGSGNSFFGRASGEANKGGSDCSFFGEFSGYQNTTGEYNSFFGRNSGRGNETGGYNSFFGINSGTFNKSGNGNVVIGAYAGPTPDNDDKNFRLYIDVIEPLAGNGNDRPLIYGEFDNNRVFVHGDFKVNRTDGFNVLDVDETSGNVVLNFGRLGIGVQPGDNKLNVNGKIFVNGTATKSSTGGWIVNSDARLKKEIMPLDSYDILHKVIQMQGVSYRWNDNETGYDRPDGVKFGFIAQDLEKVWPSKISTDQNGFLQTSYGDYDPMFVEAIKALADKNETLENKVEFLEKELQELKELMLQKFD